jgi:hypothetical protein
MYIKHDLKSFYITCSFEYHNDLKIPLLEKIFEQEPDSFTDINSEQTNFINKLDWKLSGDYTREWVKIIKPKLDEILSEIAILNSYGNSDINQIWFQQYGAGNIHGWHTHGSNFTGVYYLELSGESPKTELLSPINQSEIIVPDVKEGDILLFPSHVIHRAPMILNFKRKTIISFNFDFSDYSL